MKVSVLVPVYNGEPFLTECLESILAQDFADMEILIADDASTDGSVALIQRYATKDQRIRCWQNQNNLGPVGNFNLLLKKAGGKYIKYVLADDKLATPDALNRMTEVLDNDESVSLVASATQIIDSGSQLLRVRNYFRKSGLWDGKRTIVQCLEERGNVIGEPSVVMFRKEQAARGFSHRLRVLADWEMWFHLLEQGSFGYIQEPLCAFRVHPNQDSAFCARTGVLPSEHVVVLEDYFAKPWLRTATSRRALFAQIYNLRKWQGRQDSPLTTDLLKMLRVRWYVLYWLRHKSTRPFTHLIHWLKRQFESARAFIRRMATVNL